MPLWACHAAARSNLQQYQNRCNDDDDDDDDGGGGGVK